MVGDTFSALWKSTLLVYSNS